MECAGRAVAGEDAGEAVGVVRQVVERHRAVLDDRGWRRRASGDDLEPRRAHLTRRPGRRRRSHSRRRPGSQFAIVRAVRARAEAGSSPVNSTSGDERLAARMLAIVAKRGDPARQLDHRAVDQLAATGRARPAPASPHRALKLGKWQTQAPSRRGTAPGRSRWRRQRPGATRSRAICRAPGARLDRRRGRRGAEPSGCGLDFAPSRARSARTRSTSARCRGGRGRRGRSAPSTPACRRSAPSMRHVVGHDAVADRAGRTVVVVSPIVACSPSRDRPEEQPVGSAAFSASSTIPG